MKFDASTTPTPPTPQQLTELNDVLVSATELQQVYDLLARHPRVVSSPGSGELFEACLEQINQDLAVLDEQLKSLLPLAHSPPLEPTPDESEPERELLAAAEAEAEAEEAQRFHSQPDLEPTEMGKSVFDTVRKAFRLEDFIRQQLVFSLASAQSRRHLRLELQLKMIILSAEQRCRLLEERYGFARSKSVLVQGLRRQTTRFLSKITGEKRNDID
jgi:flagellar hook-length control protein FliK